MNPEIENLVPNRACANPMHPLDTQHLDVLKAIIVEKLSNRPVSKARDSKILESLLIRFDRMRSSQILNQQRSE